MTLSPIFVIFAFAAPAFSLPRISISDKATANFAYGSSSPRLFALLPAAAADDVPPDNAMFRRTVKRGGVAGAAQDGTDQGGTDQDPDQDLVDDQSGDGQLAMIAGGGSRRLFARNAPKKGQNANRKFAFAKRAKAAKFAKRFAVADEEQLLLDGGGSARFAVDLPIGVRAPMFKEFAFAKRDQHQFTG